MNIHTGVDLSTLSDADLLSKYVSDNDQDAFGVLVERHGQLVRAACERGLVGSTASPEDAIQTVFHIAARKAAILKRHPLLAGWLYTTAHYVARSMRRNEALRQERVSQYADGIDDQSCSHGSVASGTFDPDVREKLTAAMSTLPDLEREVLVRHFFENESFEQIARDANVQPGSVRVTALRARKRLRKKLEREGVVLSMAALVAGLEAEGVSALETVGSGPLVESTVGESVRGAAEAAIEAMDRTAAMAKWGRIGMAAGLVITTVGVAGAGYWRMSKETPVAPPSAIVTQGVEEEDELFPFARKNYNTTGMLLDRTPKPENKRVFGGRGLMKFVDAPEARMSVQGSDVVLTSDRNCLSNVVVRLPVSGDRWSMEVVLYVADPRIDTDYTVTGFHDEWNPRRPFAMARKEEGTNFVVNPTGRVIYRCEGLTVGRKKDGTPISEMRLFVRGKLRAWGWIAGRPDGFRFTIKTKTAPILSAEVEEGAGLDDPQISLPHGR